MKNNFYTCIIIDDEPIAIKIIQEHLGKITNIECINTFTNALSAMEAINIEKPDLLFLDINMPGISGVEFLKTLNNPPKVIFTTAYRNFAVDAFELDALDYLVKPISFERFLKAVNKFLKTFEKLDQRVVEKNERDHIILKSEKKNYKVRFNDILYIESLDNYVKVKTVELSLICYESLSSLEELMPPHIVRIHRSYLVNMDKIKVFTSSYVELDDTRFTIGRNYKDSVLKFLS